MPAILEQLAHLFPRPRQARHHRAHRHAQDFRDIAVTTGPFSIRYDADTNRYIYRGTGLAEITPRIFSFNSPYGACPTCTGLGTLMGVDPDKVVRFRPRPRAVEVSA